MGQGALVLGRLAFGRADARASHAGLSGRWPVAIAAFMTAEIRWRVRRAVSRFAFPMGCSARRMSAVVILSTGLSPNAGYA